MITWNHCIPDKFFETFCNLGKLLLILCLKPQKNQNVGKVDRTNLQLKQPFLLLLFTQLLSGLSEVTFFFFTDQTFHNKHLAQMFAFHLFQHRFLRGNVISVVTDNFKTHNTTLFPEEIKTKHLLNNCSEPSLNQWTKGCMNYA